MKEAATNGIAGRGVGVEVMGTTPVLVFDGDCGFCTTCAEWVERRWPDDGPKAVPWQVLDSEGLAQLGLTLEEVTASAWWVESDGQRFGADQAIGGALRACRRPWSWLGAGLLIPPGRWVGSVLYLWIARHRHRLPGGTPACRTDREGVRWGPRRR